jgi:hypothetical protein
VESSRLSGTVDALPSSRRLERFLWKRYGSGLSGTSMHVHCLELNCMQGPRVACSHVTCGVLSIHIHAHATCVVSVGDALAQGVLPLCLSCVVTRCACRRSGGALCAVDGWVGGVWVVGGTDKGKRTDKADETDKTVPQRLHKCMPVGLACACHSQALLPSLSPLPGAG